MSNPSRWDFEGEPEELIGRYVKITHSYTQSETNSIRLVEWVGKKTFRASGSMVEYRLSDGIIAGKRSKMDWGTSTYCTLLTDQEAADLGKKWAAAKLRRENATFIRAFRWEDHPELLDRVHKELLNIK